MPLARLYIAFLATPVSSTWAEYLACGTRQIRSRRLLLHTSINVGISGVQTAVASLNGHKRKRDEPDKLNRWFPETGIYVRSKEDPGTVRPKPQGSEHENMVVLIQLTTNHRLSKPCAQVGHY